jgi:hypothetical protein
MSILVQANNFFSIFLGLALDSDYVRIRLRKDSYSKSSLLNPIAEDLQGMLLS